MVVFGVGETVRMAVVVRVISADEVDEFLRVDQLAFQFRPDKNEPQGSESWARGELDRAFGAFDGSTMVGIGRNYSFDVTVPGGARVPAAAVSWIGVLPTHRRRGILTALMDALADDSRQRGEPVSMLTASEGSIYRRFGYGCAVDRVACTIDSRSSEFVASWRDAGSVRFVTADEAATRFPLIYEQTRDVVGSVARPDFWWPEIAFERAEGPQFFAMHETDGVADGFVGWRVTGDWIGGVVDRTVEVFDLQAATPEARLALWRFVLDIDLTRQVKCFQVPLHDPVRWVLADVRQRRLDFVNDGLWVKVLDVATLLQTRRYEVDDELVMAIDGVNWRLTVADGTGSCSATTDGPDLTLPADVLGAVSLGQRRVSEFPGLTDVNDPSVLARADRLFATSDRAAMLSYF